MTNVFSKWWLIGTYRNPLSIQFSHIPEILPFPHSSHKSFPPAFFTISTNLHLLYSHYPHIWYRAGGIGWSSFLSTANLVLLIFSKASISYSPDFLLPSSTTSLFSSSMCPHLHIPGVLALLIAVLRFSLILYFTSTFLWPTFNCLMFH